MNKMDHSQAKCNAARVRAIWCIHLTSYYILINDSSVKAADKARLKGYLKIWKATKMLIICAKFDALKPLSILSLVLQGNDVDIVMSIESTLNSLKALMSLLHLPLMIGTSCFQT